MIHLGEIFNEQEQFTTALLHFVGTLPLFPW